PAAETSPFLSPFSLYGTSVRDKISESRFHVKKSSKTVKCGTATCLLNACGEQSNTSESIYGPTTSSLLHARILRSTSIGTIRSEHIRVWVARRPSSFIRLDC